MNRSKIIIFLLVALAVGFWIASFVFKVNAPKSKAAGDTMTLSFNPATSTVAVNADFTVTLLAKPSVATILRGYKTKVTFDKAVLALKSIEYKTGFSTGLGNATADLTKINTDGFFELVGEDTTKIGKAMTTETGAELATLTFTALTATGTSAATSESLFYTHGVTGTNLEGFLVEWSAANGTMTETKLDVNGGGSTGGTCTSFTDDFSGTSLNTTNFTSQNNNAGTVILADGQATLNLPDSTENKGVSIYTTKPFSGDFTAEVTLKNHTTTDNKLSSNLAFAFSNDGWSKYTGILKAYNKTPGELVANWNDAGTNNDVGKNDGIDHTTNVRVKIERVGSTFKLYYMKDGGEYILLKQLDDYYSGPGGLNIILDNWGPDFPQASATFDDFKLTCASTGGTTGNVNLKIKAKFQGITKQPAAAQNSMNVKVKVYSEGVATPYEGTGAFTADEKGIWSGTIGVNIPSITGKYKIMLKGPQHLQKKVCESTPTETSPGVYRCATGDITLVAGDNNLDFSGITFLVGDLDQNGIVDSVDFGLVKNCLGKTDATCVASSDLNRDGRVDTQDFSLVIAALGVRTDEL